jgi:hypothetical protein
MAGAEIWGQSCNIHSFSDYYYYLNVNFPYFQLFYLAEIVDRRLLLVAEKMSLF